MVDLTIFRARRQEREAKIIDMNILCLSSNTLLKFRFDAGSFLEVIVAPFMEMVLVRWGGKRMDHRFV